MRREGEEKDGERRTRREGEEKDGKRRVRREGWEQKSNANCQPSEHSNPGTRGAHHPLLNAHGRTVYGA